MSRDVRSMAWRREGLAGGAAARRVALKRFARFAVGACLGALLVLLQPMNAAFASPSPGEAQPPQPPLVGDEGVAAADAYFSTTPQLDDALTPLKHLPARGDVVLHATVVIAPDALETPMAKSFDMEVAALMSAYQARGYELDGFAFSWTPRTDGADDALETTKGYRDKHRAVPSLLLFRKDDWRRKPDNAGHAGLIPSEPIDVAYDLVFLVGDSPSYGIQPRAFEAAARCALLFNGVRGPVAALSPTKSCDRAPSAGSKVLNVVGPTYSGSMQSLAVSIGRLACETECAGRATRDDITVHLISPSASVPSNRKIHDHGFLQGMHVDYATMSWSLEDQMWALTTYLCENDLLPERKIVFLVEESTFGRGAQELAGELTVRLDREGSPRAKANCLGDDPLSIQAKQFPPNISSIRAEHSRLRKAESAAQQKLPTGTSRLLELDMDTAEQGTGRPPVYQPRLSSRSDELMLFRLFDSLRVWGKPDVVVIVATDIRDRLFLLSEVRKSLPWALPAMLETDYLMVHPDYRAISRGAVVVPSRDPVVCMRDEHVVACRSGRERRKSCEYSGWMQDACELATSFVRPKRPPGDGARASLTRVSFSTDQAANVFRAIQSLVDYRERVPGDAERSLSDYASAVACPEEDGRCQPQLSVATMAGFASLGDPPRSTMVAADFRLALQRPWYVVVVLVATFLFLTGVWLYRGTKGGSVMSNFGNHVILDSRWLTRRLPPWLVARDDPPTTPPREVKRDPVAVASLVPRTRMLPRLIVIISAAVALAAMWRFWQVSRWGGSGARLDPCFGSQSCHFSLADGRDIVAVYCVWGLYACVALIGVIRLCIAGRRHAVYGRILGFPGAGESSRPWLIPVVIMVAVIVVFCLTDSLPVSVDRRSPWLLAMVALVCGAAFLVVMGSHLRRLGKLTLSLSRTIAPVKKRKGMDDWPSPQLLQQAVQTPFNLSLGKLDVATLQARPLDAWLQATLLLINGNGVYPPTTAAFIEWQRQLVAELKLLVVALRWASWCAMAAPLAVLLAMAVYAPVYERWLRPLSIALLLASFTCTVIIVLRLEKDPMLGPMFTRHGDNLSFGGALQALWPKFVAMGAVLVPLVLPDAWSWLHTLIRSINSLG